MNESTEVTVSQVEACLALFKAVRTCKSNAVFRDGEDCIDSKLWNAVLDAYADVAEQWDW